MRSTKIAALVLAGTLMLPLYGCSQTTGDNSGEDTTASTKEPKATPDKVELKNYDFPEFLNDIKQPDVLGSPVYVSFAVSDYLTELSKQPFEDYECTQMIGESLYVYSDGKFKGLLDAKGDILVRADTYTSIAPCSGGTLALSRDKELNAPDDYLTFTEAGEIREADPPEFKADNISVTEEERFTQPPEEDAEAITFTVHNLTLADGSVVGEGTLYCDWEKIEAVSAQAINTARPFNAYYRVEKNGEYYFVCFDRFYNYTIYNGAYGYVRLKVGESYGECYIFDHEDYLELTKIIESFGETSSVKAPAKDQGLDFIQLETGYSAGDVTTVTLSADGYCLTDHSPSGEKQINKYFTILDKESYVSLVRWVDQVLSKEYVR